MDTKIASLVEALEHAGATVTVIEPHAIKITTRSEVPDDQRVVEGTGGGYVYYTPTCTGCGWEGDEEDRREHAVSGGNDHLAESISMEELVEALKEEGFDAYFNFDHGPTEVDIFIERGIVNICRDFNREDGGWEAQLDNNGDATGLEDGPLGHAPIEEVVSWLKGLRDAGYPSA